MSRAWHRWWPLRRRLRAEAMRRPSTAEDDRDPDLDVQLAFAVRLLKDAQARGHHNETQRLLAWIDRCLDERLRQGRE